MCWKRQRLKRIIIIIASAERSSYCRSFFLATFIELSESIKPRPIPSLIVDRSFIDYLSWIWVKTIVYYRTQSKVSGAWRYNQRQNTTVNKLKEKHILICIFRYSSIIKTHDKSINKSHSLSCLFTQMEKSCEDLIRSYF